MTGDLTVFDSHYPGASIIHPIELGASETGPPAKNSKKREKQQIRKVRGRDESESGTGIPEGDDTGDSGER